MEGAQIRSAGSGRRAALPAPERAAARREQPRRGRGRRRRARGHDGTLVIPRFPWRGAAHVPDAETTWAGGGRGARRGSGLLASFVMSLVYRPLMRAGSEETLRPEKEAQAGLPPATIQAAETAVKAVGGGLPPDRRKQALGGKIVHYVYGPVGAGFALAARTVAPLRPIATGLVFGGALWLLSDEVLVPLLRFSRSPRRYPASTHVKGLASHLVYGVAVMLAGESRARRSASGATSLRVGTRPVRRLRARGEAVPRGLVRAPLPDRRTPCPRRASTRTRIRGFLPPCSRWSTSRRSRPSRRPGQAPEAAGRRDIDRAHAACASRSARTTSRAVAPLVELLLARLAIRPVAARPRRALFALLDGVRRRLFTTALAPAGRRRLARASSCRSSRGADYDFGELLRVARGDRPEDRRAPRARPDAGELTVADVARRTRAIARGLLALVDGDPGREGRDPLGELPRGGALRPRLPLERHRRLPAAGERGRRADRLHAEALGRAGPARVRRGAGREGAALAAGAPGAARDRGVLAAPPPTGTGSSRSTRWSARAPSSTTARAPRARPA